MTFESEDATANRHNIRQIIMMSMCRYNTVLYSGNKTQDG